MTRAAARESKTTTTAGRARRINRGAALAAPGHGMPVVSTTSARRYRRGGRVAQPAQSRAAAGPLPLHSNRSSRARSQMANLQPPWWPKILLGTGNARLPDIVMAKAKFHGDAWRAAFRRCRCDPNQERHRFGPLSTCIPIRLQSENAHCRNDRALKFKVAASSEAA